MSPGPTSPTPTATKPSTCHRRGTRAPPFLCYPLSHVAPHAAPRRLSLNRANLHRPVSESSPPPAAVHRTRRLPPRQRTSHPRLPPRIPHPRHPQSPEVQRRTHHHLGWRNHRATRPLVRGHDRRAARLHHLHGRIRERRLLLAFEQQVAAAHAFPAVHHARSRPRRTPRHYRETRHRASACRHGLLHGRHADLPVAR